MVNQISKPALLYKVSSKTGMVCVLIHLSDHWSELTDDNQVMYGAVDCYLNGICIGNVGFYLLDNGEIELTDWYYNE